MTPARDRFGLGWRPELALAIHQQLDRIDVLEFLAEDWFDAPTAHLDTLRAWCALKPVHLHGTSLGLASAMAVTAERLQRWRRLVAAARPERWSEHLAFVRGGGIELGHLAAPPRTAATIAGAVANLDRCRQVIGSTPLVENVATLVEPPGSDRDEPAWIAGIIAGSGTDLLLDLHNLHANAVNHGWDAVAALDRLPLERVAAVHLAGGRRWRGRVLDDHQHAVPETVFRLLGELAARLPRPVDVIVERDGSFPPLVELLDELDRARAVMTSGRARRRAGSSCAALAPGDQPCAPAAVAIEAFLARLYTDAALRAGFLADPLAVARAAGLPEDEAVRLAASDRTGLVLAADSLAAKRGRGR